MAADTWGEVPLVDKNILDKLKEITEEERAFLDGKDEINRELYMDPGGARDTIMSHKLLDSNRLITIRPHTRFVHFPEHTHDFVEIVYMCQGTTTHIVNGTKLTLREGELLLMGQNTRQEVYRAGENEIAVNFIIRPEFFRDTLPYLGEEETPLRRFLVDCLCGGEKSSFLYFCIADVLPVQHLIENLLWTMISELQNRREITQITFALLFIMLTAHTDRLQYTSCDEKNIFYVLRYIEEHYRDGSLTEIADTLHYDTANLSREIKRKTGKNYTQLVQDKRMAQAAWLLANTNKKVDEIAEAVGYENVGYFHRLFSAAFGTSPKKYRDGR